MLRDQERSISHFSSEQRDKETVRQRESGRERGLKGESGRKLDRKRCFILITPLSRNRMKIVTNGLERNVLLPLMGFSTL